VAVPGLGSTVEIIRSGATRRAIVKTPSSPSTVASDAPALARAGSNSRPSSTRRIAVPSLVSASTSSLGAGPSS
jgi:hypothetical protein